MDVLKGVDKNNNTIYDKEGNPRTSYHIRMKGVGDKCLLANYSNPVKVFETLYDGYPVEFDLKKTKLALDIKIGQHVLVKNSFKRNIKFTTEDEKIRNETMDEKIMKAYIQSRLL